MKIGAVLCGLSGGVDTPCGMTLRAYCDKNNVPYKVMENFVNGIRKKIVEVEVVGCLSGRWDGGLP